MASRSIDMLKALLEADPSGEEIATQIAELILDEHGRNALLAKLSDSKSEQLLLRQEIRLTRMEAEVFRIIKESGGPVSAEDISEKASEAFQSLRWRSNASATAHSLILKALLGKIHFAGRKQMYFGEARDSIDVALRRLGMPPTDFNLDAVTSATGLPSGIITDIAISLDY